MLTDLLFLRYFPAPFRGTRGIKCIKRKERKKDKILHEKKNQFPWNFPIFVYDENTGAFMKQLNSWVKTWQTLYV